MRICSAIVYWCILNYYSPVLYFQLKFYSKLRPLYLSELLVLIRATTVAKQAVILKMHVTLGNKSLKNKKKSLIVAEL